MLEICECRSAGDLRAFFALSRAAGYSAGEAEYLKRFAHPSVNPLRGNGPMRFLLARADGHAAGRLLTYRDEGYVARTGRNCGFFALFDPLTAEAGRALLERAQEIQREWGSEMLLGPIAPDGSGFFQGLADDGACAPLTGLPNDAARQALAEAGFGEEGASLAFELEVPAQNPWRELAARAGKRFRMDVESFERLGGRARLEKRVAEASPADRRADLLREFSHIAPFIDRRHTFAAVQNGVCAGYILALREKKLPLRIATLETAPGVYTPAAAVLLLDAVCESCRAAGLETVNASIIEEGNFGSLGLVRHLKMRRKCKYLRYMQKISIN